MSNDNSLVLRDGLLYRQTRNEIETLLYSNERYSVVIGQHDAPNHKKVLYFIVIIVILNLIVSIVQLMGVDVKRLFRL